MILTGINQPAIKMHIYTLCYSLVGKTYANKLSLTSNASLSLDHPKITLSSTGLQPFIPNYCPCQESNSDN